MAALDFPTPTKDGQIFKADNGVWYTWKAAGSYWSGSLGTAIGNLEGYYVNKTGDKMFGNLTLGTESTTSIVLNATSGAATFDGRLTLNGSGAGTAAYIGNNGEVQITYDGSITAAGSVQVAGDPNTGVEGTKLATRQISACSSASRYIYSGFTEGNTNPTFTVQANGTASFAGYVTSGSSTANGQFKATSPVAITPSSADAFLATHPSVVNCIRMRYDGTASFAGKVSTSAYFSSNRTNAGVAVFEGQLNSTQTSLVKADGSAGFSGDVQVGNYNPASGKPNEEGSYIFANGSYYSNRTNSASAFFVGNLNRELTAKIGADGSATFNRYVFSGSDTSHGYFFANAPTGGTDAVIIRNATSGGQNTAIIKHDGSATFAGNVDVGDGKVVLNANVGQVYIKSSTSSAVQIQDTSNNNNILLNTNGSATFAGTCIVGIPALGVSSYTTGQVYARGTGGDAFRVIDTSNGTDSAQIFHNGSVQFAGGTFNLNSDQILFGSGNKYFRVKRDIGELAVSSDASYRLVWSGLLNNVVTSDITAGGVASFASVNGQSVFIQLEADDDTKYTTTTDEDGNETLVYNGAVLDVKDRLTKLDTALTGLKAALVSTTDHASLKSALIAALADI